MHHDFCSLRLSSRYHAMPPSAPPPTLQVSRGATRTCAATISPRLSGRAYQASAAPRAWSHCTTRDALSPERAIIISSATLTRRDDAIAAADAPPRMATLTWQRLAAADVYLLRAARERRTVTPRLH